MCETRYKGKSGAIVPVEQLVGDVPIAITLEQCKDVGSTRVGSSQFAGRPFALCFSNPASAR
jgi:hypothetical protein